jgi:hypothetical protein
MPFQLFYRHLPNLPGYLQKDPTSVYDACDSYLNELESGLQSSYAVVSRNLETAKQNQNLYERHTLVLEFEMASFVLVKDESVRRGRSKKLEAAYIGSYEDIRIEGPTLWYAQMKERNESTCKPSLVILHVIADVNVIRGRSNHRISRSQDSQSAGRADTEFIRPVLPTPSKSQVIHQ